MKKYYYLVFVWLIGFSAFCFNSYALTYISDNSIIYGTWTKEKSPIYIMGNSSIPKGATLTIEPGVVVILNPSKKIDQDDLASKGKENRGNIKIEGTLKAKGTEAEPIIFKTSKDDMYWGTICFNESIESHMSYCFIDRAGGLLDYLGRNKDAWGAISIYECNPVFENCTVINSGQSGIFITENSQPIFSNTIIANSSKHGVITRYSKPRFYHCNIINNNGYGFTNYREIYLESCLVWGNENQTCNDYCEVKSSFLQRMPKQAEYTKIHDENVIEIQESQQNITDALEQNFNMGVNFQINGNTLLAGINKDFEINLNDLQSALTPQSKPETQITNVTYYTTSPSTATGQISSNVVTTPKISNVSLNTTTSTVNNQPISINKPGKKPTQGKSSVDINIPQSNANNPYRFALIIGNEDYTKYQSDIESEINVDYARADAETFATYCKQVLGVPDENIILLKDAISTQITREVNRVSKMAKYSNGKAEIIFYYAGHGMPHEVSKEAYIMPVDVTAQNIEDGIKLSWLYATLTENPSKMVYVFLDACFTGGSRDQGLLAARGVRIQPKQPPVKGNCVVFASSSEIQSSLAYEDQQHGMFTFYLLKKLQDTKGEVSL